MLPGSISCALVVKEIEQPDPRGVSWTNLISSLN